MSDLLQTKLQTARGGQAASSADHEAGHERCEALVRRHSSGKPQGGPLDSAAAAKTGDPTSACSA
eukprot:scaffold93209_cov39-Phaeocystis_antarctica.AAC.2